MAAEGSAAPSATVSALAAKRVPGRPFRPGQSGNPGGVPKRQQVLFDAVASEFGGEAQLTALEHEYVTRAAEQLRRADRERNNAEYVRLTRSAALLIDRVRDMRRERQPAAVGSDLDAYLRKGAA
jgi:hypothetical protein